MASSVRYMSVDIKCVANGNRHDAREVCAVALADGKENVLLVKKVKPKSPVFSYLTPLTGYRKGDLDDGENLEDVIAEVKGLLGRDVVLVGQGVKHDITWLSLEEGKDYKHSVNLADMFKTYNPRYEKVSYFSLSHEANTLIHQGFISEPHSPVTDAIASIRLFNTYNNNNGLLEQARGKLLRVRPPPSFANRNNHRYEGVCMASYFPARCFCEAPTATN